MSQSNETQLLASQRHQQAVLLQLNSLANNNHSGTSARRIYSPSGIDQSRVNPKIGSDYLEVNKKKDITSNDLETDDDAHTDTQDLPEKPELDGEEEEGDDDDDNKYGTLNHKRKANRSHENNQETCSEEGDDDGETTDQVSKRRRAIEEMTRAALQNETVGKRPPKDMKRLVRAMWYKVVRVARWGHTPALLLQPCAYVDPKRGEEALPATGPSFYKPPKDFLRFDFQVGDKLRLSRVGYSKSRNLIAQSIEIDPTNNRQIQLPVPTDFENINNEHEINALGSRNVKIENNMNGYEQLINPNLLQSQYYFQPNLMPMGMGLQGLNMNFPLGQYYTNHGYPGHGAGAIPQLSNSSNLLPYMQQTSSSNTGLNGQPQSAFAAYPNLMNPFGVGQVLSNGQAQAMPQNLYYTQQSLPVRQQQNSNPSTGPGENNIRRR